MAVYQLDDKLWFPDPHDGEPSGLVAVGGDLSPERLLLAYSKGFFPWYSFYLHDEPQWYCPLDRFVIFPDEIHISHSMKQLMKQGKYLVTFNQCFEGVINSCAAVDDRDEQLGAWLGTDIIEAYTELHRRGHATSVDVWAHENDGLTLAGGLYGVMLKGAFFGESMFSLAPNASKLALIIFAMAFGKAGGKFIDCQFETPHLRSMGGRHITYEEYMRLLDSD